MLRNFTKGYGDGQKAFRLAEYIYLSYGSKGFQDKEHAKKIYGLFVDELVRQGTLHVNCFSSIHYEASEILFGFFLNEDYLPLPES